MGKNFFQRQCFKSNIHASNLQSTRHDCCLRHKSSAIYLINGEIWNATFTCANSIAYDRTRIVYIQLISLKGWSLHFFVIIDITFIYDDKYKHCKYITVTDNHFQLSNEHLQGMTDELSLCRLVSWQWNQWLNEKGGINDFAEWHVDWAQNGLGLGVSNPNPKTYP
jgi:hypothetical protein